LLPTPLGTSLVEVYESLGIELYKPYLRAQMEADMKLIAEGKKSRQLILEESMKEMQRIFKKVTG
jgi:DNA topoisomerase III